MPSAPLRAFSYTMAGGASSCGQRPNAVFKCPDGYAGSYPERLPPQGGYHDFRNPACNPFSNKIVLMDEVSLTRLHAARLSLTHFPPFHQVHNLVRPSPEILRNDQRMLMLQRLRQLLRTAENAVIIGLSGTPLADVPAEAAALQNLIKGKLHHQLNDEGFVSVRALLLSSHSPFLHINTPYLSLSLCQKRSITWPRPNPSSRRSGRITSLRLYRTHAFVPCRFATCRSALTRSAGVGLRATGRSTR